MPRRVQIIVPSSETGSVVEQAQKIPGAGSIQVQKGSAVKPQGDVVTIEGTNDAAIELMQWCNSQKIGVQSTTSVSTSEPYSLLSPSITERIHHERNEATQEEVGSFLHKPTRPDLNTYMIMFGAGVFAGTGIATDAVHLAIAGFILAPGFQPLLLISFGLVNGTSVWKQGIKQTFLMYLALLAGAVLTGFVMQAFGHPIAGGKPAYLPEAGTLIRYWASLSPVAYYIAATAGFVGSFVAASRQPSLIPSITIAVALIPSMSIVGIAATTGAWDLVGTAILRWLADVALLLVFSVLAFLLKKNLSHKRGAIS